MTKKVLILSILLIGVLVLVVSCQLHEENIQEPETEGYSGETTAEFLERAKAYFETTYDPAPKTKAAKTQPLLTRLSGQDFTPVWDKSQMSAGERFAYMEFPLIMDYQCAFRAEGDPEGKPSIRTANKLVIRRDQQTGELELFTSLIIPEAGTSFLLVKRFCMERPGKFSGRVYLFTPDGQYYQGKLYRDGKQIGTCQLFENEPPAAKLTRSPEYADCWWYNSDPEWIFCSYLPGDEHPICQEVASEDAAYDLYEYWCYYTGGSSGGGTGGGTGDGDGDGDGDGTGTGEGDGDEDGTGGGSGGGGTEECPYHGTYDRHCQNCARVGLNYSYPITNVQMQENYPNDWCEFYTLAALCGGSPYDYQQEFYRLYFKHGIRTATELHEFYRRYLTFYIGGVPSFYSFFVAAMNNGSRAILSVEMNHIYVICGLRGFKNNSAGALMDKYDTNDANGNDPYQDNIPLVMPPNGAAVSRK